MISEELRRRVEVLEIHARKLVDSAFSGEYETVFRGQGLEFRDLKEYSPGDDVRFLDGKVLARTGRPHIRTYKEERELVLLFLVDLSASTLFGKKRETLMDLTALLALTAAKNNDRFALGAFTDRLETFIPPGKGEKHLWRVLETLVNLKPKAIKTRIGSSLEEVARLFTRRSVVFLMSDFLDQNWEKSFRAMASRHDLTAVSVTDPLEEKDFPLGLIPLQDLETGQTQWTDGSQAGHRLFEIQRKRMEALKDNVHKAGGNFLEIPAGTDWFPRLVAFFQRRHTYGRG